MMALASAVHLIKIHLARSLDGSTAPCRKISQSTCWASAPPKIYSLALKTESIPLTAYLHQELREAVRSTHPPDELTSPMPHIFATSARLMRTAIATPARTSHGHTSATYSAVKRCWLPLWQRFTTSAISSAW